MHDSLRELTTCCPGIIAGQDAHLEHGALVREEDIYPMPEILRSANLLPLIVLFALTAMMPVAMYPFVTRRARRTRHVAWSVRNTPIVREGEPIAPGVRVSLHQATGSLSVARVAIWNPVPYYTAFALAPSVPGLVEYQVSGVRPDVQILDASLLEEFVSDGSVSVRAGFNHRQADIRMPPLEGQQGAVFQLTHTGSEAGDLRVTTDDPAIPIRFHAPGTVYLNTRSRSKLANYLSKRARARTSAGRVSFWRWYRQQLVLFGVMSAIALFIFFPLFSRFPTFGSLARGWDVATPFVVIGSLVIHVRSQRKGLQSKVALPPELSSFLDD